MHSSLTILQPALCYEMLTFAHFSGTAVLTNPFEKALRVACWLLDWKAFKMTANSVLAGTKYVFFLLPINIDRRWGEISINQGTVWLNGKCSRFSNRSPRFKWEFCLLLTSFGTLNQVIWHHRAFVCIFTMEIIPSVYHLLWGLIPYLGD